MPFDALTIAAVRHELEQKALGARVQGIVAAAPLTLSLEIYRAGTGRNHLLLSAHPQHARIHFTPTALSRDPQQQPPLLLLLRKYVRGGTIVDVAQPSHERILGLSIAKRIRRDKHQEYRFDPYFMHNEGAEEDDGEEEEPGPDVPLNQVQLIVEIMGRLSNIVLVGEDGAVMDSIKRVPASINRYRTVLPNQRYVPPPPQSKRDPSTLSVGALSLEIARAAEDDPNAPAWKGLVSGVAAVSPTLAREVAYRALGSVSTQAADTARSPERLDALLRELQAMLRLESEAAWEPTVAWKVSGDKERKAQDFAPYPLKHLEAVGADLEPCDSTSEAAARYFAALASLEQHGALKAQVRASLEEMRGRHERRLAALREQLERAASADELRRKGEYLLAFMHTLQPGQRTLSIPEEHLTIELDPALTPVENAQAFFREYHKARSAEEGLPAMVEDAEIKLRFFDELATSLDLASAYDDIRAVQADLQSFQSQAASASDNREPSKSRGKGGKQEKLPQPLRLQTSSGAQLLVGRTARQNDAATFRLAAPEDLWFHARNIPGSHVILRAAPGLTDDDIREAAERAAGYSGARENPQVEVVYTEKRYVRKIPNAPPGLVTYRNERSIRVVPRRGR